PHSWEVRTRTGSGVGGGVPLVRLSHVDARTWRFAWAGAARPKSSSVEAFKDAILGLHGRDGRTIYVVMRGVELTRNRPMEFWQKQQLLSDKLEPRTRAVEWSGESDALAGSRWTPRIRRWKAVLSRPGTDAADDKSPKWAIEPGPPGDEKASAQG